ncbi:MAG: c-type cytochrome [Alphaproteobacteria bacterium]|nr:c-type cytochrome [Alphaproteobacteria bacterium]MCB9791501.1 c-type cytochrome [Alphaproteobacteria bacterium]
MWWLLLACATPPELETPTPAEPTPAVSEHDYQVELRPAPEGEVRFTPPARDAVPEGPFGEAVKRGRQAFTDTPSVAGAFMGNGLSCSNCHLDEGRRPDSAPMWGAWGLYPAFRKKNDHVNTMEERIIGCFTYSLDAQDGPTGAPPAPGSQVLTDLQAYMFWLAKGAPVGEILPGRGYPSLEEPAQPADAGRGAEVYAARCEVCHGADGQGAEAEGESVFPPLWGPDSYNWGAGMHRINTAAGFIYANMPLGQPRTLSEQEAWDVAAFVNSHPRPADPREAVAGAETDARFHSHDCAYGDEVDGQRLGDGAKR